MTWRILLYFALILLGGCRTLRAAAPYPGKESIRLENPRIVVIGDTQRTSNWEFWRERNFPETQVLFKEIARRDPALILHCGDMTARGGSEKHWDWLDQVSSPVLGQKIPIFPVLGNHEYYGDNAKAFENITSRFPFIKNKTWYEVSHKGVGCILLNSNLAELTPQEQDEQFQWYGRELKRMDEDPSIRWIFVVCHQPPFTNSEVVSPSKEMREQYAPLFLSAKKSAIFFSGHCHSYERFVKEGKTFIVTGGGGGPRQTLAAGPNAYPDQFKGGKRRFFHFCLITIESSAINLEVIRLKEDGTFDMAEKLSFSTTEK